MADPVRVRILGVGMGPAHVTPEVAEALQTVDYVLAADKSDDADDGLLELRRRIVAVVAPDRAIEVVAVPDPERDRSARLSGTEYEGAVADWSAVLLREHLGVPGSRAGFAYAAFCVTMTGGRVTGDRLVHLLGRARCLTAVALIGAVGLGLGLAGNGFATIVGGFALLGLGLSIMVPVLYSTAADTDGPSGPAIAAVAALGCVGLLVGPSLIGLVAQLTSIATALYLLPPFTLAAGALGVLGVRLGRRDNRSVRTTST